MANIIEPCCAERQLPYLLREERGHAVVFQTNGDVTLEHWMKAVMLMAGAERPRVMTLAVPTFTDKMMRVVGRYLQLEWVKALRLMTTEPLSDELLKLFAERIGCDVAGLGERLELSADANIIDGLLAFSGREGTVIIQGRIFDIATPGLSLYAGVFGRTDGIGVRAVTDMWNANFKARRYQIEVAPPQAELPKKRKTNRKKRTDEKSTETMAGASQAEKGVERAE